MSKHRDHIEAAASHGEDMRYTMRKVGGRSYLYDNKAKGFVPLGRVPKIRIGTKMGAKKSG